MLAPNRLSHKQLGISFEEYNALITVMNRLERGELKHITEFHKKSELVGNLFCMSYAGTQANCGTVACIGGWVALTMGESCHYVMKIARNNPLMKLYYPAIDLESWRDITPAQAAQAVHNFLATGEPRWTEVIQS